MERLVSSLARASTRDGPFGGFFPGQALLCLVHWSLAGDRRCCIGARYVARPFWPGTARLGSTGPLLLRNRNRSVLSGDPHHGHASCVAAPKRCRGTVGAIDSDRKLSND